MRQYTLPFVRFGSLLLLSLVLASCTHGSIHELDAIASDEDTGHDEPFVVLVSNDENIDTEKQYYEALLTIQNERVNETAVNILNADDHRTFIEDHEVDSFPTLILVAGQPPHEQVNGDLANEDLMYILRNHYE
ncbi:hypothetical protein [Geomicrobium sp. JCM 19039]|uniref:hypothetical protein n=1 Tax=Geomicrobium sp. JCM 19039 TaxID=1460636 RepID=UPI00045F2B69|nr:hypothetical protein [Geomicrobium sp. JCM 19039]GAK14209.1 hypothetical protein JCM19039_4110 [Geomicrobium sp. JCM 19039]